MSQITSVFKGITPGTFVETLTGNSGDAVGPDSSGNINVKGDGTTITIAGDPGTNTLTASTAGTVATSYTASDASVAHPSAGNINFLGGTNITSVAAGSTVAYGLTGVVDIANGGTNASSFTNTNGVVYFDGTRLVDTAVGSAGQVLTSNGTGVAPTFQASGGGGGVTIATDINGPIGPTSSFTVTTADGASNCGASVYTDQIGTSVVFFVNDQFNNQFIGLDSGGSALNTATGNYNIGLGTNSLTSILGGSNNTALGVSCLAAETTGNNNIGIGQSTLHNVNGVAGNIAIGTGAMLSLTGGSYNAGVGDGVGGNYNASESSNVLLNHPGVNGESNTLHIGAGTGTGTQQLSASYISGIYGITTASPTTSPVLVSDGDQLGTVISSIRFKDNVVDMEDRTADLMKLRPVNFTFKKDLTNYKQWGLIAEEVYEVFPEIVNLDAEGRPHNVRYHDMPAILLAELQKSLKRIEVLENKLKGV